MKTDSIFYRIFQTDPGILFELLGQPANRANGYEFRSVELKQLSFRIDGILLPKPDAPDQTIWFIEVQFQKDPHFYHRFFAEIALFLDQNPHTVDWQAIVLFPNRTIEPEQTHLYRSQLNSNQVHRIYLNELEPSDAVGIGLIQLIVADTASAVTQAQNLITRTRTQGQPEPKIRAIIGLIETIMIYKFPQLSRAEIEKMFGLSDLRQTKVYQEALQEGEVQLVLRQLTRRFGTVSPAIQAQVQALSLPQLESLGEALLDFSQPSDLQDWFRTQG